jgi:hypothetical protein
MVDDQRRAVETDAVGTVTVEVPAPRQSVAWREPGTLDFHVVRWPQPALARRRGQEAGKGEEGRRGPERGQVMGYR